MPMILPLSICDSCSYCLRKRRNGMLTSAFTSGDADWCSTIADLFHFRELVSLFNAAPCRRIPIAAGNVAALFPPQRKAPQIRRCEIVLRILFVL
ncbi:hypothetical protein TNCV_2700221 [Trichonephila clavipes]|nr:hypothetical protein TNCV_2700221 [Trichonephila clavipes]